MAKVEFRLLQFIISHLTGDRVSVALLHWDGAEFRVAESLDHLSVCDPGQRNVVRRSVRLFVREGKKVARDVAKSPMLDLGLRQLFPVREGLGAALYWTPVTVADTANPAAHFAQLSATLGLDREHGQHARRFSARALGNRLSSLGEDLKAVAPGRVKVEALVKLKKEFRPPLSWKNGRWHHAVPLSLHGLDSEDIDSEVERLVGLVELAMPRNEVPVVIALLPEDASLALKTKREAKLVKDTLKDRHCEILTASLRGKSLELAQVRERVEKDVLRERKTTWRRKSKPGSKSRTLAED